MSDIDKQDLNSEAIPFFARFLEGQFGENLSEEEMEATRGGSEATTLAYPSDQEDDGGGAMTKKYPSDQDESGTGCGCSSFPDITIPLAQELIDKYFGAGPDGGLPRGNF